MEVIVRYNRDTYGELIEKKFSNVKNILENKNTKTITLVIDDGGLKNKEFKINRTLTLNINMDIE